MAIDLATNSKVFLGYALITGALLLLAGLLLGLLRLSGRDVSSPLRTYRGWLLMIPIVLGTLLLGREAQRLTPAAAHAWQAMQAAASSISRSLHSAPFLS